MKKLIAFAFCLAPLMLLGAIGPETTLISTPTCLYLNQQNDFTMTVYFFSPDGERLDYAQFWTGNFWNIADVEDPAAVDMPGYWSHQINPAGNVISWWFTREGGYGGDVGDGHSITFAFTAMPTLENDLNVTMYIEGDTNGQPPHNKSWLFAIPLCADDDTADDDTIDDDTIDDDTINDDTVDDDTVDDDTVDDDTVDDDTADDDTVDDDMVDDDTLNDDTADDDVIDDDTVDDDLGADDDSGTNDDTTPDDDAAEDDDNAQQDDGVCGC